MNQDCERQLLSAWISGDNTEHIKEFGQFTYLPEIFKAVSKAKKKNDLLELSKLSGTPVADLAELMGEYIPSAYDGYYRVAKESKIRAMLENAVKSKSNLSERLEAIIREIDSLQDVRIQKPSDPCAAYKKEIERRKTEEPLKYGIPTLDSTTGGIRAQELTTIAARPSLGKTALALQVAFNIALKKKKVLFFPLEMAPFQLMERIVCREVNIDQDKLKNPLKMDDKDQAMLDYCFGIYESVVGPHLHFIEKTNTLAGVKRNIEQYRPDVVIIDQLTQLRENKRFNSIREQFSYMTRTLKEMTISLDVPIILLAQINRDGSGREPLLVDLKESGSIEEDSDNVIMIHQTDDLIWNQTPMDLIIRKQRNGARDVKIPCMYLNKKYIFREAQKE